MKAEVTSGSLFFIQLSQRQIFRSLLLAQRKKWIWSKRCREIPCQSSCSVPSVWAPHQNPTNEEESQRWKSNWAQQWWISVEKRTIWSLLSGALPSCIISVLWKRRLVCDMLTSEQNKSKTDCSLSHPVPSRHLWHHKHHKQSSANRNGYTDNSSIEQQPRLKFLKTFVWNMC